MLLITGITGRSGSHFLEVLVREKYTEPIRCVVRRETVPQLDNCALDISKCLGDIRDAAFLNNAMQDVDTVFHIADKHSSLFITEAAIRCGVKRLILVQSTSIYSKYRMASERLINSERQIFELLKGKEINWTVLRPTMIFGSLYDDNMITFIKMCDRLRIFPLIGGGRSLLQPIHMKDLAQAYWLVLKNPEITRSKTYVVSGKDALRIIDVLKIIAQKLHRKNCYVSIPLPLALFAAKTLLAVSFGKSDFREKVLRLTEDRNFDHREATEDFGFHPQPFETRVQEEIDLYLHSLGRFDAEKE